MPQSVEERILEILRENLGTTEIQRETKLEDAGADSLDLVETVLELEEEFEIEIPDDVAETFKTVGDIVAFVESKVNK